MCNKRILNGCILTLLCAALWGGPAAVFADDVGTAFTYQGELIDGGTLVNATCDFEFTLWDLAVGGTQIGPPLTPSVVVSNGRFTEQLDFGDDRFTGQARWLKIRACCPTGCAPLVTLNPRQELTPAPYALALPAIRTTPSGCVDEPDSPNVIGGFHGNSVDASVGGGTIGGGGSEFNANSVTGQFGTIGGGFNNTAGGQATVGGGVGNEASGVKSTVGGGGSNSANTSGTTVGGGFNNEASNNDATVSGGQANTASGKQSTVPGGFGNTAAGKYSFAAGRRATIETAHHGTFVWADSDNNSPVGVPFTSTGIDQFLIRAAGGVGIGTTGPNGPLHVQSTMNINSGTNYDNAVAPLVVGDGDGAGFTLLIDGNQIETTGDGLLFLNFNSAGNVEIAKGGGRVGIGRTPQTNGLEVEGNASKTDPGSWLMNSDRRIKQDIQSIERPLEMLEKIRLVSFRYTDQYRAEHPSIEDQRYMNVIAQEFAEVFPNHVQSSGEKLADSDEEILQVDTYPLTIYSAAAIQELHEIVKEKNAEVAALRMELEERVAALEKKLVELTANGER